MTSFKIQFSGWESSGQYVLLHANKNEKDFNKDCKEIINKIISESDDRNLSNEDVFPELYEELISDKYGYVKYEVSSTFILPGTDSSYISDNFNCIKEVATEDSIKKYSENVLAYLSKTGSHWYEHLKRKLNV